MGRSPKVMYTITVRHVKVLCYLGWFPGRAIAGSRVTDICFLWADLHSVHLPEAVGGTRQRGVECRQGCTYEDTSRMRQSSCRVTLLCRPLVVGGLGSWVQQSCSIRQGDEDEVDDDQDLSGYDDSPREQSTR
jgi:hypothetical protein